MDEDGPVAGASVDCWVAVEDCDGEAMLWWMSEGEGEGWGKDGRTFFRPWAASNPVIPAPTMAMVCFLGGADSGLADIPLLLMVITGLTLSNAVGESLALIQARSRRGMSTTQTHTHREHLK